jgi:hypothetical protein
VEDNKEVWNLRICDLVICTVLKVTQEIVCDIICDKIMHVLSSRHGM